MKIKALTSFTGAVSMHIGEVKDIDDSNASALISCGYAEAVKNVKPSAENADEAKASNKKGVKSDENKRDNA
ncbi:MAG: hypothetical protein J6C96_05585 [Oscillospiraceae bacterium]|nr:hypothetical protein [Oscillospiraceae bacterium]